jgi:hypothetical protein
LRRHTAPAKAIDYFVELAENKPIVTLKRRILGVNPLGFLPDFLSSLEKDFNLSVKPSLADCLKGRNAFRSYNWIN